MPARRWSHDVTERSNALDLESKVFEKDDPKAIARSLKRSAEHSKRRKSERAGKNLPAKQKRILERAKDELRKLYGREPAAQRRVEGRTSAAEPRGEFAH